MRMWNVEPQFMCKAHILGEHREIHMMVGTLNKGKSVTNYIKWGLLEINSIQSRHDQLVEDFKRRDWKSGKDHTTPIKLNTRLKEVRENWDKGFIHPIFSLLELLRRCPNCRECYNSFSDFPLTAEQVLDQWNVTPVQSKWEGLMIAWDNETPLDGNFVYSSTLQEERAAELRKLERQGYVAPV